MATITFYNLFRKAQLDGNLINSPVDFDTDTIKVALANSTYTPSATTHDYFADITNEVTGNGYTAGGDVINNISVAESGGVATVDGDDITWSQNGSGFSDARYAIIYKDSGAAANSPLVGYIDFTTAKGNTTGDLSIAWNASGIFTLS